MLAKVVPLILVKNAAEKSCDEFRWIVFFAADCMVAIFEATDELAWKKGVPAV